MRHHHTTVRSTPRPTDDRVIHAGGAIDKVERGMETLVGEPQLGRVWTLVGDPARVI
jgi:hypothetical protein